MKKKGKSIKWKKKKGKVWIGVRWRALSLKYEVWSMKYDLINLRSGKHGNPMEGTGWDHL